MFGWLTRRRALRDAGLPPERARLLGVRHVRVKGITFLVRGVSPLDFLGRDSHPFMPWRDARDRVVDDEKQRNLESQWSDPAKAGDLVAQVRKAYTPILLAGVLHPKVTEDGKDGTVSIDDLFVDPQVANALLEAIGDASFKHLGKKKSATSSRPRPSSLTPSVSDTASSPAPSSATGPTPTLPSTEPSRSRA